jgi:hypothetical protein
MHRGMRDLPAGLLTGGALVGAVIGVYENAQYTTYDDKSMLQPAKRGIILGLIAAYGAMIGAAGVATAPLWIPCMALERARPRDKGA